jgi:hypothetical protein
MAEPDGDLVRQGEDGAMLVGSVVVGPTRQSERGSDADEGPGAESGLLVVGEAYRQDDDVGDVVVDRCAEGDSRRSRLQRLELELVVAHPLGEERDHAAMSEQLATRPECRRIAIGRDVVLGPVHGDDAGQFQERPERQDREQGRLAEKAGVPAERRHQQEAVDQPVQVVGHQHDRGRRRDVPRSLEFDPAEEDADQEAGERPHRRVGQAAHPGHATYSSLRRPADGRGRIMPSPEPG